MKSIVYHDHKLLVKQQGDDWQASIPSLNVNTAVHLNQDGAIEEAKRIIDATRSPWRRR